MASADKSVELVIRMRDEATKNVRKLKNEVDSLQKTLARQMNAAASGAADMQKYSGAIQQLTTTIAGLSTSLAATRKLEELGQKLKDSGKAYGAAKEALKQFNAALGSGQSLTTKQANEQRKLQNAVNSTQRALDKAQSAYMNQRSVVQGLGINIGNLAREQAQLVSAINNATKSQREYAKAIEAVNALNQMAQQHAAQTAAQQQAAAAAAAAAARARIQALKDQLRLTRELRQASQQADVVARQPAAPPPRQQRPQTSATSDALRRINQPTQSAVQSFSGIQNAVAQATRQMASATTPIDALRASMDKLKLAQQSLTNIGRLTDSFNSAKNAAAQQGAELRRLEQEYTKLKQAQASGGKTAENVQQQQALAAAVQQQRQAFADAQQAVRNAQNALTAAGVSASQMATIQQNVINTARQLAQAEKNLADEVRKRAEAQKNAAAAAKASAEQQARNQRSSAIDANIPSYRNLANAVAQAAQTNANFARSIQTILNPASQARTTLQGLGTAFTNASNAAGQGRRGLDSMRQAYAQLRSDMSSLQALAGKVDGFVRQQEQTQRTAREYANLRTQYAQLQAAMAGNPTAQQVTAQQQLATQLTQTGQRLAEERAQLALQRNELNQAGVNTRNLAQTQRDLADTARLGAQAEQRLSRDIDRARNSADRASKAMRILGNSQRTALSLFQRIRGQVLSLTANYVSLFAAIHQVSGVIAAGKQQQQLHVAMQIVSEGDIERAKELENYLKGAATRIGVPISKVQNAFANFMIAGKSVGKSTQQLKYNFEAFANYATMLGKSPEDIQGIMKALEQMYSKNAIQMEELRGQLGDRMPGAVNMFKKALGVTNEEWDKLAKKGKLPLELIDKVAVEINEKYKKQIEQAQDSVQAWEGKVSNAWTNFQQAVADTGVMDKWKDLLKEINAELTGRQGAEWAYDTATAIKFVIDRMRDFVKALKDIIYWGKILISIMLAKWFLQLGIGAVLPTIQFLIRFSVVLVGTVIPAIYRVAAVIVGVLVKAFTASLVPTLRLAIAWIAQLAASSPLLVAFFAGTAALAAGWALGTYIWDNCTDALDAIGAFGENSLSIFGQVVKGWVGIFAAAVPVAFKIANKIAQAVSNAFAGFKSWALRKLGFNEMADAVDALQNAKNVQHAQEQAEYDASIDRAIDFATGIGNAVANIGTEFRASAERQAASNRKRQAEAKKLEAEAQNALKLTKTADGKRDLEVVEDDNADKDEAVAKILKKWADQAAEGGAPTPKPDGADNPIVPPKTGEDGKGGKGKGKGKKKGKSEEEKEAERHAKEQAKLEADLEDEMRAKQLESDKLRLENAKKTVTDLGKFIKESGENYLETYLREVDEKYRETYEKIAKLDNKDLANKYKKQLDDITALAKKEAERKAHVDRTTDAINILKEALEERNKSIEREKELWDLSHDSFETYKAKVEGHMEKFATLMNENKEAVAKFIEELRNVDPKAAQELQLEFEKLSQSIQYSEEELQRFEEINKAIDSGLQNIFKSSAEAMAGLLTGTKSLGEAFKDVGKAFVKFASDFLMKIAEMIVQAYLYRAVMSAIGFTAQGTGSAGAAIGTRVFHSGGIVGAGGGHRTASAALFAHAPRYHSGGVVGLASGEVPAILQRGEEVLTRDDPRHAANGGGGQLTVVNTFNPADVLRSALASDEGRTVLVQAITTERTQVKNILL